MRRVLLVETLEDRCVPAGGFVVSLPTETEPNDTLAQANPIQLEWVITNSLGSEPVQTGSINGDLSSPSGTDVDYFTFSVTPGQLISVSLNGAARADGVVPVLLDANGNPITDVTVRHWTDDNGDGIALSYYTRDGGTFYVQVGPGSDTNGDGSTSYMVGVSASADSNHEHEPNDSIAQANPIVLHPYPWLVPYTGGTVQPSTTAATDVAPPSIVMPIWNWYPPPWIYGQQSGYISGTLDGTADVDYFSFSADAGQKITVSISGVNVNRGAAIELLDADGNVLASASAHPPQDGEISIPEYSTSLGYYTQDGGQFFVRVRLADGAAPSGPSDYTVDVSVADDPFKEHEPNDSPAQANPIQLHPPWFLIYADAPPPLALSTTGPTGIAAVMPIAYQWYYNQQSGSISGNLDGTADVDYYSFSAAAGRKITVSISGVNVIRGAAIELLDADGNVLATATSHPPQDGEVSTLEYWTSLDYYTTDGGQFFVRVTLADGAAASGPSDYTVDVSVAPDPFEEHEPNDGFDTANPILLPSYPWYAPLQPVSTAGAAIAFPIWPSGELHGFISGQIDTGGAASDQDFFSFSVDANHTIHIELTGGLAGNGGRITLYDANQQELVSDADASDGLTLDWTATDGGTFYVRVDQPTPGGDATDYQVNVTASPVVNPIQGPDEQEPNDTFDQSNPLPMEDLYPDDPGLSLRFGSVEGIAGGPTNDQDAYHFDASFGEHVVVGINGLICDASGDVFDSIRDFFNGQGLHVPKDATLDSILGRFPDLQLGTAIVTVYNSAGDVLASSSDDGGHPGVAEFDVPADGTYYAVVTVITPTGNELVNYRLSGLVRGFGVYPDPGEAPTREAQAALLPGEKFSFVDANGDTVNLSYKGKSGIVYITFTGSEIDGSDIAAITVDGARAGNLVVQTDGSAEVGAVEIFNSRRFGKVRIDGNLGYLSSDTNLSKLVVQGVLGEVSAAGHVISQLKADTFDSALAIVKRIGDLNVNNDPNAITPPAPTYAQAGAGLSDDMLAAWIANLLAHQGH